MGDFCSTSTGVSVGVATSSAGNEIEGRAGVLTITNVEVAGGSDVDADGAGCVAAFFTSNSCP